jgi:TolA-binding protein
MLAVSSVLLASSLIFFFYGRARSATTGANNAEFGAAHAPAAESAVLASSGAEGGTGATPAVTGGTAPAAVAASASTAATPGPAVDPLIEQIRLAKAKIDAKLYDQGIDGLKLALSQNPSSASAPAALLLVANTYSSQGRAEDAMASYVEVRSKYGAAKAIAAEATYRLAELTLQSKQQDKEAGAHALLTTVVTSYPKSEWAPKALMRRAALEEREKMRASDGELGTSVPAALLSYRALVRTYPKADGTEAALVKLADMYDDIKRYDLAADILSDLAKRFPANTRDAAWRAGEMYEKRVKDMQKARQAYLLVPASSSHYRDAQKKLQK